MVERDRTERAHDSLLDVAVATLAANPGASLQEIADAAGISRATLHRRFAGRDELILAISEWAIGQLEGINDAVELSGLRGRAAIEALLERAIQLAPKIGFLISEHSLECNQMFMDRVDTAQQRWHRIIEDGQRLGEIRVDLPARWIADAIEGLMIAVFHGIRRGLTAPNDALRLVRITLLDGVTTGLTAELAASATPPVSAHDSARLSATVPFRAEPSASPSVELSVTPQSEPIRRIL
jgi:AcrR family transcriptional regulator